MALLVGLAATGQAAAIDAVALHAGAQTAQLVAICGGRRLDRITDQLKLLLTVLGMLCGGETAVRRHIQEQSTAQGQFLKAAGKEDQQLANRRLVQ